VQLDIFRFLHHTHPTAAKLFHDAVMRNGFPDHRMEILGLEMPQVNLAGCGVRLRIALHLRTSRRRSLH
jgi:hypothetical protein